MKKKFLFSMLAILLAGFGFGGVSLADDVACVEGGLCYDTLADAISNANDGGTIILQSSITNVSGLNFEKTLTIQASGNNITLTGAANDSNKNTILGTVAAGKTVTFVGVKFDLTAVKYANAGYAAGFNLASTAGGNVGGAENKGTVAFSNCTFDGRLTVVGKATFDGCTFNYDPVEAYQVEIRSRDNVSFSNCTFNGGDRNINIYDPTHTDLSSENTKITFSSCTFTAPSAVKKGAIVIHEQREGSNLDKFNVVVTNATKNGTYPATPYSGETRAKMYSNGLIMVDDYNTGVVTEGGDVVVYFNGSKVYSNPKIEAGGVIATRTVTFDGSGVTIEDGAKLDRPADPTKSCYRFDGWYDGNNAYDFNSVVTSDLTLTSHWTYNCGGGSSSSRPSNNTSSNTGNNNTGTNNTGTVNTGTVETGTVETGTNNEETANQEELKNPEQQDWYDNNGDQQEVLENGLTREMNNAYEFAYRAGITTMETIEDAKMEEGLTRIAMAKMLSQYAINVLKKTPDTNKECKFGDVSAELDEQYDNGVTLACQLGIMGVGITDFRPFDPVVRAEFGTALSRLLFGLEDGEDKYYTTHLAKLKEAGIISNDDPTLEELRGYVMLMLMRSAK